MQTVLEIASCFPDWQNIIPQCLYKSHTSSDRRRYVEEVVLEAPIMFYTVEGDACGIRCTDALSSRFSDLYGRDDMIFQTQGPSVSIRLMVSNSRPL